MYVPPEQGLRPRLSWKVFKQKDDWHIFGLWGLAEWRRSTPIVAVHDNGQQYICETKSGSTYFLDKDAEQEDAKMMSTMLKEIQDGTLR